MSTFAERLRALRELRNLTQDALAERVGTSKQVLSRYETGQRIPKISMVERLADALNVSLSELSGYDDPEKPPEPAHSSETWKLISAGCSNLSEEKLNRIYDVLKAVFPEDFKEGGKDK